MKLINIGFGNYVSDIRIVAVMNPDSAPVKRVIAGAKQNGLAIDATYGRHCKTAILTDSNHVVLSSLSPEVVESRINTAE
ncbi:MAG: DUF370 domain-containing protein [Oscillospiraceae bacterium]|jgi:regulator of extracellular matrix RemA (YlzA/DUF370 family)|nr:DUF370 domain-containing protein [Oscillospiraceae bacterium]